MVQVQDYDLLGRFPGIESFDVDRGIVQFREAVKCGWHGQQFVLANKLSVAAAHYFGLSLTDFDSMLELCDAMEAMNAELMVH